MFLIDTGFMPTGQFSSELFDYCAKGKMYSKPVKMAFDTGPVNAPINDLMQSRLGLAYERRFTGYGDLETTLAGWARE